MGSDTQPTVEAVALLVAIAIGVLAETIDMVIPRDRSEVSCGWWCLVLEVYTCDDDDEEEESQALLGAFLLDIRGFPPLIDFRHPDMHG